MAAGGLHRIHQPVGHGTGCAFEADGKHVLMLPGPPRECNPMWKECAMPYLYKLAGGCIVSRNIRVFGLGESNMENILHDMMEKSANPTIAPYARTSECFARVTAKADTPAECEKMLDPVVDEILKLLGDDVYGVDVDSLEQVVGDGLRERQADPRSSRKLHRRSAVQAPDRHPGRIRLLPRRCVLVQQQRQGEGARREEGDPRYGRRGISRNRRADGCRRCKCAWLGHRRRHHRALPARGGGTEDKPTGLVYISVWYDGKFFTRKMQSSLGRDRVRMQAASTALDLIRRHIF